MDLRIKVRPGGLFIEFRRNIGKAIGLVIRHKLAAVAHVDHKFAGLDKAANSARQREALIGQRQCVADGEVILGRIVIRQPDAVRTLRVIVLAVRHEHARDGRVCRHGQRHAVSLALGDVRRHGEIARGLLHARDPPDLFQLRLAEARLGDQAIIGVAGLLEEIEHIPFDAVPLHIEADKHPDAERDHQDHGEELRPIEPHGSPKLFKKHGCPLTSRSRRRRPGAPAPPAK